MKGIYEQKLENLKDIVSNYFENTGIQIMPSKVGLSIVKMTKHYPASQKGRFNR